MTSLVVTSRLDQAAITELDGDAPLGVVLTRLGVRREPLTAVPHGGGVSATARLWCGPLPVALAAELVDPGFCARLPAASR